jgi:hypothetical protein
MTVQASGRTMLNPWSAPASPSTAMRPWSFAAGRPRSLSMAGAGAPCSYRRPYPPSASPRQGFAGRSLNAPRRAWPSDGGCGGNALFELPKVTAVVRANRLPCQNIGKGQKFTPIGVHQENLGLRESGFVEGQNAAVECRSAEGQFDRFPALASELLRRNVAVLVVTSSAGARAAKQATSTLPIVFSVGDDPTDSDSVGSLNRPERNATGVYQFTSGLEAKRLGLLREMVPQATSIAVLVNPNYSGAEAQLRDVQEAAAALHVQLSILRANSENDLSGAFSRERDQLIKFELVINLSTANALGLEVPPSLLPRTDEVIE